METAFLCLIMVLVFVIGFFIVNHLGRFIDEMYGDTYIRPRSKRKKKK